MKPNGLIRLWLIAFFSLGLAACQTTRVVEGPAGVYEIVHRDGGLVNFPWDYRITTSRKNGLIPAEQLKLESAVTIKGGAYSQREAAGYIDRRTDGQLEIRLISRNSGTGDWYRLPISGIHRVDPKKASD